MEAKVGDHVVIKATGIVIAKSSKHGECYQIAFAQKDFQFGAREVWVESEEIVGIVVRHHIPVGSLVELDSGVRMFVIKHGFDCGDTPVYWLSPNEDDIGFEGALTPSTAVPMPYTEDSLILAPGMNKLDELRRKLSKTKRNS